MWKGATEAQNSATGLTATPGASSEMCCGPAWLSELVRRRRPWGTLAALGRPLPAVLYNGGSVSAAFKVAVILAAFYLGQAGGQVVAGVLLGKGSPGRPGGLLQYTGLQNATHLPHFLHYKQLPLWHCIQLPVSTATPECRW